MAEESVSGTKEIAVDTNRVRIPAKYRSFLGDDISATIGPDGCVLLIPRRYVNDVLKNYIDIDPYMSEYKELARAVNRMTTDIELDSQSRITIDDDLKRICRGLAGTESVTFCGRGRYVEAWPTKAYNARYGNVDGDAENFDSLIADLKAKLGRN